MLGLLLHAQHPRAAWFDFTPLPPVRHWYRETERQRQEAETINALRAGNGRKGRSHGRSGRGGRIALASRRCQSFWRRDTNAMSLTPTAWASKVRATHEDVTTLARGWSYSPAHDSYVRISHHRKDKPRSYLIELAPRCDPPATSTPTRSFLAWWEMPIILDLLPWMQRIKRTKKYIAVIVDEGGDITSAVTK